MAVSAKIIRRYPEKAEKGRKAPRETSGARCVSMKDTVGPGAIG